MDCIYRSCDSHLVSLGFTIFSYVKQRTDCSSSRAFSFGEEQNISHSAVYVLNIFLIVPTDSAACTEAVAHDDNIIGYKEHVLHVLGSFFGLQFCCQENKNRQEVLF